MSQDELNVHYFKRWLSMLRRAAEANPVAGDVLTYQGNNQAQWLPPGSLAAVPNHDHTGDAGDGGQLDHGTALTGLVDDDHTVYVLLAGRSGGQTVNGGTDAGDDLRLRTTSNAAKGHIYLGTAATSAYDETNDTLGIGTATPGAVGLYVLNKFIGVRVERDDGNTSNITFAVSGGAIGVQVWGFQNNGATGVFAIRDNTGAASPFKLTPGADEDSLTIDASGHVGMGTAAPAASAQLEISSTTGALLLPRMTTAQRTALTAVNGMVVYDATIGAVYAYEAGAWVNI